jgi:DNA-binding MarR family transcriptional regulator
MGTLLPPGRVNAMRPHHRLCGLYLSSPTLITVYLRRRYLKCKVVIVANNRKTKSKQASEPSLVKDAYVTLMATADRVRASYERIYAPFEITAQQYNVLRILRGAEPEGLPTLTIADRMIERTPGVTRIVDRLESNGLVKREIRPSDRRRVYCRITKKGLNLLELLDDPVEEANHAAFRALTVPELKQLIVLLDKTRRVHEPE